MTATSHTRYAAAAKRDAILRALAPYDEGDMNDYTCKPGMTCLGISEATGLGQWYVSIQARWLYEHGLVTRLGKRRVPINGTNVSYVYMLSDKGRRALKDITIYKE